MQPEIYQQFAEVISFFRNLSNMDQGTIGALAYACYLYIITDAPNHKGARRRQR